jgi:carbon storage regulator
LRNKELGRFCFTPRICRFARPLSLFLNCRKDRSTASGSFAFIACIVWKGVHAVLVLTRRPQEKILLPGLGITIEVIAIQPGVVRLGIDAPAEVTILREELAARSAQWQQPAPASGPRLYRDPSTDPRRVMPR